MDRSWIVWGLSALVFIGAIRFLKHLPGARDFRILAGGLGIVALIATTGREDLRWHLLWFTPIAIVTAYLYALRRLLALSRRINRIGGSMSDPEQTRRAMQDEVAEYNREAPEDQKTR